MESKVINKRVLDLLKTKKELESGILNIDFVIESFRANCKHSMVYKTQENVPNLIESMNIYECPCCGKVIHLPNSNKTLENTILENSMVVNLSGIDYMSIDLLEDYFENSEIYKTLSPSEIRLMIQNKIIEQKASKKLEKIY